jgi:adenosine deaminase
MALPALPDLHRHLDGSLRPETIAALADDLGLAVPPDLPFQVGMGLLAALDRFAFTLRLLQTPEAIRRVAAEIWEDARAEGVGALEIRFAPQLHLGAPPEEIVDAALDGVAGQAGLILCGLYGEPPSTLARLVELARTRPGVVGIDLAGGPLPTHTAGMADYAPAFTRARDLGIGRTVHAGEGRPPAEIRVAVETLHAQRIGHGTTLLDDPAVADLIADREVTVEACLSSNVHVSAIPDVAAHPLPRWLRRGVRATVCTDNTFFSQTTAPREHELAQGIPGMTTRLLEESVAYGHTAAFSRA